MSIVFEIIGIASVIILFSVTIAYIVETIAYNNKQRSKSKFQHKPDPYKRYDDFIFVHYDPTPEEVRRYIGGGGMRYNNKYIYNYLEKVYYEVEKCDIWD